MRYFFDFHEGERFFLDDEGVDLPSLDSARIEAARAITGHARDIVSADASLEIIVAVRTEDGPQFTSRMVLETQP